MQRKPRKLPVYYVTMGYRDGAVVGCYPDRKPPDRILKRDNERVDPDLVFSEGHYKADGFAGCDLEHRIRRSDILSNRMNMRRTVRDLVLPKLAEMEITLASLKEQLDRIERAIASLSRTQP